MDIPYERYFEEWGNRLANYYSNNIEMKNNILRYFKYWNIRVLHPDFNPCSSVEKPPAPIPNPPPPVANPKPTPPDGKNPIP